MFRLKLPVLVAFVFLFSSLAWASDEFRWWDLEANQYYEEPALNSVYEDSLYKYQKQNVLFMNNPNYVLTAFVGRCIPSTFKPFMLPFYKNLYTGQQDKDLVVHTCQNMENQQGATVVNVHSTTTQFTDIILDIVFPSAYAFEYRDWATSGGPVKQHIDNSASFTILVQLSSPGFCLPTVGAVTDGSGTSEITIEFQAPEQGSTATLELNCTSPIKSFHYNGFNRQGSLADVGHLDGAVVKKVTLQGPSLGGGVALPPSPVPNPNAPVEGPKNCPIEKPSSIIRVDNLSFGEEIQIVGTDVNLVYSSEFASSYQVAFQNLNRQKSFNPEAWTLSIHHYYDKNQDRLFLGSGRSFVKASSSLSGNQEMVVMDGEVFVFDENGKHLATKSALTGAVKYQFSYNAAGYLTTITDAFGNVTQLARNTNNQLLSITSPWGQVTTMSMGAAFSISEIKNPNNESFLIEYYEGTDLLRKFTTPAGRVTEVVYDGLGRISYTKKVKGSYQFGKMKVGNTFVVSQVTQMGRQTDMESEINPLSGAYVRKVIHPDGVEEVYTENPNGSGMFSSPAGLNFSNRINDERFGALEQRMAKYTSVRSSGMREMSISKSYVGLTSDPFNYTSMESRAQIGTSIWKNIFSKTNMSLTKESPEGIKTYILLDSNERPASFQLNQDYPTLFEYYPNGNLKKMTQNGHDIAEYTYNAQGFLSKIKNNRNEEVQYTYDLAGRVLAQTSAGLTTTLSYNGDGDLLSVTPPGRPAHLFTFDLAGDMTSYRPPILSAMPQASTRYNYNEDKQLTQLIAPQRPPLRFNYDESTGLLKQIYVSAGEFQEFFYEKGRINRVRSFDRVDSLYSYDGDLLTSIETRTFDRPNSYERISYAYNTNLLPKRRDVAADWMRETSATSIAYDKDFSIKKVGDLNISYQSGTGRVQGTQIGKIYDQYSYDGYGRLVSYQSQYKASPSDPSPVGLYSYQLSRDNLGRINGKTETIQGKSTAFAYTYDNHARLIGVAKNGAAYASYQYDSNGNRTVSQIGRFVENATYDDQDRLLTFGNKTFQYYDSGDMKSKQRGVELPQEFTYNSAGSLKSVRLPQGSTLSFSLDAGGARIATYRNGKLEGRAIYQDYARIAADFDEKGRTAREYVHALGPNTPDYMIFKGQKYRYVKDHLGSPRLLVRITDGQVLQRLDYDVWGRVELDTNRGFQPYGFAGGIYELNTGLLKFGARDYDPEVGRWTSKDPILFGGGDTNLFGYVLNDPVNLIDPAGLYWFRQPWQRPGVVGREKSIVEPAPRGQISDFIERYVPAGYTFGENHDRFVDWGRSIGAPDWLVNIPSMPHAYLYSVGQEVLRSVGLVSQQTPEEQVCK